MKAENLSLKDDVIVQAITDNVVQRCDCVFTKDHISEQGFQCFPSSPQAVTYRARLRGTSDATVEDLLQYLEDWIQEGATISVKLQRVSVDSTCDVGINSFTESECGVGSGSDITGAITGAVVGVLLVLVIIAAVIVLIMLALVRRKRQASLNLKDLK